jgi:hypothetical protein
MHISAMLDKEAHTFEVATLGGPAQGKVIFGIDFGSVLEQKTNAISVTILDDTGYSEHAIRSKIQKGVWMEGRVWRRAPDGKILIDEDGYNEWVENGNGLSSVCDHRLPRGPATRGRNTAHGGSSPLSPDPLVSD